MPELVILCSPARPVHDERPATAALSDFADACGCTQREMLLTRTGSLADRGPPMSNSGRAEMMQPGLGAASRSENGPAAAVVSVACSTRRRSPTPPTQSCLVARAPPWPHCCLSLGISACVASQYGCKGPISGWRGNGVIPITTALERNDTRLRPRTAIAGPFGLGRLPASRRDRS